MAKQPLDWNDPDVLRFADALAAVTRNAVLRSKERATTRTFSHTRNGRAFDHAMVTVWRIENRVVRVRIDRAYPKHCRGRQEIEGPTARQGQLYARLVDALWQPEPTSVEMAVRHD